MLNPVIRGIHIKTNKLKSGLLFYTFQSGKTLKAWEKRMWSQHCRSHAVGSDPSFLGLRCFIYKTRMVSKNPEALHFLNLLSLFNETWLQQHWIREWRRHYYLCSEAGPASMDRPCFDAFICSFLSPKYVVTTYYILYIWQVLGGRVKN